MELLPFDVGVIGEGERTFVELLDAVDSRDFSKIKGLIYRDDGGLVRTPYRPLIENLDEVPWPHWDLLPLEMYFRPVQVLGSERGPKLQLYNRRMSIITERGCNKSCTFCQHLGQSIQDLWRIYRDPEIKGPSIRWNSARYVVDMVKHLRLRYGVDFVNILDYSFMANKKRAHEIADLWEHEGLANVVHFSVVSGVEDADYELLQRLKDIGCQHVSYGGETASNRLLKDIKKFTTVEQTQKAIDATLKARLSPIISYMVGYPTETVEDYIKTVEFWKRNKIIARPFFVTPYPGTELFNEHKDRILAQHGGDIEKFFMSLVDETDLAANISPWDDATLFGLRDLASTQNLDRLKSWAEEKR